MCKQNNTQFTLPPQESILLLLFFQFREILRSLRALWKCHEIKDMILRKYKEVSRRQRPVAGVDTR